MIRLKIKILLTLSAVIIGVAAVVTLYSVYHEKQQNDLRTAEAYTSINHYYAETVRELVHFYTARAHSNIQTPYVLEAIKAQDRDTLYRLILPRWKVIQTENPSLIVMQFHNADGTSLLRMHRPDVFGDAIAQQRSMVADIHKHHRIVYGFEEGRRGLAFRILVPIVDQGHYLGAVEFGIATPYLIDKVYRYTGYRSFFMIDKNHIGQLSNVEHYVQIGDYTAIDLPVELRPLIKACGNLTAKDANTIIRFSEHSFAVITIPVTDYLNRSVGRVIFTREVPDFWEHVRQMVIVTLGITIALIVVLTLIINRVYDAVATKMSFQEMYNQTVLDAIPSPVIVTDGEQLIAANQTFLAYFNFANVADFKRKHACVCEYFEEGDTEEYLMPMRNDKRWTQHIIDHPMQNHKAKITVDSQTTIFDVKLSLIRYKEESRYVVIFTDISSMQSISMNDPLTGIANRLHFTMVYKHAINVAVREQRPLGVIFFDIDHFKRVNDEYGHLIGDEVLKDIAALVKRRLRKSDIFARWGGEEFIILLPDTPLDESCMIAKTLRIAIELENFENVGRLTCSFGVATLHENESPEGLLQRVDELLYRAKSKGRNRVEQ
ncbi:MAG: diguanylate cyclase [Sulfuricurvum sp.]|uniref:diguanylate cyclase n=1 Tax=Sulfuricurvum sp. TaxID=2025608 RepID=UPI00261B73D2|nr:diguanylate cyclase [Sulfuricurvum sp.]MDD4884733.1 diguanylate cyclase [Sulfuricurvum sp.]